MILERVQLRNFGVYAGDHSIDLKTSTRGGKPQPIVLFGGLNGGGKTTLFDAILLALYGARARCSKRGGVAYDDFLSQSIHRAAGVAACACVSVTFSYVSDGEESLYEVRRSWSSKNQKVNEVLEVIRNGVLDRPRTDNWNQLVEELIPIGLSQLFFFDGDRIRSLAEDETYSEVLGAAIKSLLGLDIVERLIADADVLARRQKRSILPESDQLRLDDIQGVVSKLQDQMSLKKTELASERNLMLRHEAALKVVEEQFALRGGGLSAQREGLKARDAELRSLELLLNRDLQDVASGALPLLLVRPLLNRAHEGYQRAKQTKDAQAIVEVLKLRDAQVLEHLQETGVAKAAVKRVAEFLESDRSSRTKNGGVLTKDELSDHAADRLRSLLGGEFGSLEDKARRILEDLARTTREIEDVARNLSLSPAGDELAKLADKLRETNRRYAVAKERVTTLEGELDSIKRDLEIQQTQQTRLLEKKIASRAENEDTVLKEELARKTVKTMQTFLERATARKIDRLAQLITESFQFLLRKKSLVDRISIDPSSFAIELIGSTGSVLPRNRLSEGEKQLFAVAVLWGLAKASSRPLPAIIDTPMARLDSHHRGHLVERYFPHASHQVIILSTDTEVDRQYYRALRTHVAKAYKLEYQEKEQVTTVREGYFWEE